MRRTKCVQVNKGSGCLFKLCNDKYDYILTAKHLLTEENSVKWRNPNSLQDEVLNIIGEPLTHNNVDAAILKVDKLIDLQEYYITSYDTNEQDIVLSGFPQCRTPPNEFRFDYGKSHEPNTDGILELEIDGAPVFDEVNGMSGGPVTKKHEEHTLIAVQCKMTTKDENENLGRTSAVPIEFFEQIITEKSQEGNELEGLTHVSLDILAKHTFKLDDMELNKDLVTRCLQRKVHSIANSLSIDEIEKTYGNTLSLRNGKIGDKNYWIGFLEALSIKNMKSNLPIDATTLNQLKAQFRVVYCEVGSLWREAIPELYGSDLKELQKDSIIFVVTNKDKKPTKTEYSPNLLMRINEVPPVEDMLIDTASIQDPFSEINIKHIYSIEKVIIDKEDILMNCNPMSIKTTIREIANDFI